MTAWRKFLEERVAKLEDYKEQLMNEMMNEEDNNLLAYLGEQLEDVCYRLATYENELTYLREEVQD